MKRKLTEKLLALHKETIRNLSDQDLGVAKGGLTNLCTCGTSSDPTVSVSCVQRPTVCDC